jgi:hypothetical protein
MLPLDNRPIMVCILKQLGSELLTDVWDGLVGFKIEQFGTMMCDTIELLHVKLLCNFGGWRDFVMFHNKFEQFTQNIKMDTHLHKKDFEMMTSFVESM